VPEDSAAAQEYGRSLLVGDLVRLRPLRGAADEVVMGLLRSEWEG
jgi:hypothetical protein